MTKSHLAPFHFTAICLAAGIFLSSSGGFSQAPAPEKSLLDLSTKESPEQFGMKPTSAEVMIAPSSDAAKPGIDVAIASGKEMYPGIHFTPPAGPWDLSAFGHIEAKFTNTGTKKILVNLRVDAKTTGGEWGSNTETAEIKPGESGTAKVFFGYAYGRKPSAKLNTSEITKLVIFNNKSDAEQFYRIESIVAGGPAGEKPPVNPNDVRTKPVNGALLGNGTTLDPLQVEANGGARAELAGDSLKIEFPNDAQPKWVSLKPQIGRWDLRDAFGVRVKFKNTGANPVRLHLKVNSNSGPTDAGISEPVAPGAEGVVESAFAWTVPWLGIKDSVKTSWSGQKGTGTNFSSDSVSSVTLSVEKGEDLQSVAVTSVAAGRLDQRSIPDWIGKRPPVEGDWVKTFDENFDGNSIDSTKWNIYAENFWDKRSHFSKDNVLVADGVAKLHYEKKTGFHNDNPKLKQTDYATGFLDTYGKWVQRYGYFEARMKLTKAPGLWPAFWLMPDRGEAAGPQWKRADTGNGGMEFDIMEYLGRWGPHRFNIAMHWDGYDKGHQQTGSQTVYFQPDKDGYITSGLLWLPGLAVFYVNGSEVFRWETPRISNVQSDMMFTNVSGGWDNNAIDDVQLPDDFVIDYVRAWQRKDLMSDVDTYKDPAGSGQAPAAGKP